MVRNLLSRLLFRKYPFHANGADYVVRVPRWRPYHNRDGRGEQYAAYCERMIGNGTVPFLPPGVKVFVVIGS